MGVEEADDSEEEVPAAVRGRLAELADKEFDPVTFVVTKVPPAAFAAELTLLDLPVFQAIRPEELSSCAWNSKEKLTATPNVVAFTRRFNHVCLWAQKEILAGSKAKGRAETITHFIRIAKKLGDLKNLHSCFALVSALDSSPIFRLRDSWALVPATQKVSLDKLRRLFSSARNWERLRRHLSGAKLPAIPYLGLYLTDLLYIHLANPGSATLDRGPRETQMNNILRVLADFQRSEYPPSLCPHLPCVRAYLNSHAYIDELQKFVEDDLYKLSLEREPLESGPDSARSLPPPRRDSHPPHPQPPQPLSAAHSPRPHPSKKHLVPKTSSLTPNGHSAPGPLIFKPSHRKAASLGSQAPHQLSLAKAELFSNETFPSATRHLLDDSLLDVDGSTCTPSSSLASSHFVQDADDSGAETADAPRPLSSAPTPGTSCPSLLSDGLPASALDTEEGFSFQGPVRRKTLLKDGKRPAMGSGWSRYWLGLWGTNLFYFAPRPLPNRDPSSRVAFKRKPAKMLSISGWMVVMGEDPFNPDSFQLQEPSRGNVYKFRAGSQAKAMDWVKHLQTASELYKQRLPANLMSFD